MIRANTFPALLIAIVAVAVLFATAVWAKPFAEARIIFEVNATRWRCRHSGVPGC